MKVNSVDKNLKINYNFPAFRSETAMPVVQTGHDEFVRADKKINKTMLSLCGLAVLGLGAYLTHKAGWWGKAKDVEKEIFGDKTPFKKVDEAKEYFEKLGIDTIFRDVTDKNLPQLNRIKDDLIKMKEYGVKFDKPKTLTISDWHKAEEYEELCRQRGISVERIEEYRAFCTGDKDGANHVFINSSKPDSDCFRHEMGHANHHRGHDSYWEAKGIKNHDFADKQLELLGKDIKVYRDGTVEDVELDNIFHLTLKKDGKGIFATSNGETRYVYISDVLAKMQEETNCYKPDSLSEQVAYIYDGLIKGDKNFSDEVMLYYDFAGGARIPKRLIGGKTYDEYIESLYNNPKLIQKLRENIKILKL